MFKFSTQSFESKIIGSVSFKNRITILSDAHWKAYFCTDMKLWPKSWLGRVILARDDLCFPPVILGSLASSHVLSVPSTESNEFNNIILPAVESFLQDTHSHLKGKNSPLATIFSDMALASCAVDWSRLDCLTKQNRECSLKIWNLD